MKQFTKKIEELGIETSDQMMHQFMCYKSLIQEVNQVLNLTAIDDEQGIFNKHFYDSLLISPLIEKGASLCDIGSGAGFPGLVLAIARPDIHVTCVEPTKKRTDFLSRVCVECGLNNVTVYNERAEDLVVSKRESFDIVTARAVAYLDVLAELCAPFVKLGGKLIAMKGQKGLEELEVSKKAIKILGLELKNAYELEDEILGQRVNLEFLKIKKTALQYPRSYAKIKKTPLSGRNP